MTTDSRRHLPEAYFVAYFYAKTKPFRKRYNRYGYNSLREITDLCFDSVQSIQDFYQAKADTDTPKEHKEKFRKFVKDKADEFYKSPELDLPDESSRDVEKFGNWNDLHQETVTTWGGSTDDELHDEFLRILGRIDLQDATVEDIIDKMIRQPKYAERSIAIRQGQPEFRESLIALYGQCMITGCQDEQVLEACHIVPYSKSFDNSMENGLLLRADIHTLFDRRLIQIDSNFSVTVSGIIKSQEYTKLKEYIDFDQSLSKDRIISNLENI